VGFLQYELKKKDKHVEQKKTTYFFIKKIGSKRSFFMSNNKKKYLFKKNLRVENTLNKKSNNHAIYTMTYPRAKTRKKACPC